MSSEKKVEKGVSKGVAGARGEKAASKGADKTGEKKTISEAEALVLLQQVTRETKQRMDGQRKANQKLLTVVVIGVGICVLVGVLMWVMRAGE